MIPDRKVFKDVAMLARENKEGFTYDLRRGDLMEYRDRGYVVAVDAGAAEWGPQALERAIHNARKHNLPFVGGWFNEVDKRFEFDACTWFEDFSQAVAFAKDQRQKAIYDCENEVVIDLRGPYLGVE